MLSFLLFQFDPSKLVPPFLTQPLDRFPAILSLVYLIGVGFVVFLLIATVFFTKGKKASTIPENLPEEVRKKLGATSTNRGLWIVRTAYVMLALTVFGFHTYWSLYAAENDARFQKLSERDIRAKRSSASSLRGWILDRSGDLNNSFAYWKIVKNQDAKGKIDEDLAREYPLDREMAHLLGTERGSAGLERTLFQSREDPTPEALDVALQLRLKKDESKDVKLTIDKDLQKFAFEQLKDKRGAVVVLNPQTGDLLAMVSNPTFSLLDARDLEKWRQMESNLKDKPMLSRALREYYVPGSTFKTFTMTSAFRAGKENSIFTSSPEGFIPFKGSRGITDANGGCEGPYGCVDLNISQAFEESSNQYFSQMAVSLGKERLSETARLFGISPVDSPEQAVRADFLPDIWNTSNNTVKGALAPRQSTIVTGKDISNYDVGLEGMGQGYAGQMTPFQMALVASAVGNMEGKLMKPKVEADIAPQMFSQVVSPQQAASIRDIMALVTEGSGGTATRVFGEVRGVGIRTGGKTGSAEKLAPVFDEKTGKPKTTTAKRKDKNGNWVEYQKPVMYERGDSWFIAIAPLERPTLAIAVVIEGGGMGATIGAPIASKMILKARELGLCGEKPKVVVPKNPAKAKKPK